MREGLGGGKSRRIDGIEGKSRRMDSLRKRNVTKIGETRKK